MIGNTITQKIGEALKAHDEVRLSTLRMLSSEFNYEKIAKQHELSEEEELVVVRREAKKRKEAIEAYTKANANDKAQRETDELKVLQEYLPPELSESEVNQLIDDSIDELGAKTMADMGKVIGLVKSKSANVDGSKVAEIVRQKLI